MTKEELIKLAAIFVNNSEDNRIKEDSAFSKDIIGIKIFAEPIFGFAAVEDEYFKTLQKQEVIGEHFKIPQEWLPQAKTVVSFFLPFTEAVRESNTRDLAWPSEEWIYGRIEGQAFLNKLCQYLQAELTSQGYESVVPSLDDRFISKSGLKKAASKANQEEITVPFTSNWSERHVAFICGLGTFGLSKGLITFKGMAGRFGSIVTELYLAPTVRKYQEVYEYCTMCGLCVENCPADAISFEKGKDHQLCSDFLAKTAEKYKPRMGCGKCQVGVPCEKAIP